VTGREVLVDRGIPGERVVASLDPGRRARRGAVEAVIEASPDRVIPPCPYYLKGCGGCQWQHLGYDAQIAAKVTLVEREMEAAGVAASVSRVRGMEEPWRYRRTAAIAIGWEAGFRPRGRRGIVEIRDCLISHPLIGRLTSALNDLLRAGWLPNYHGRVWLDCTVVGSESAPELQVVIQGIEGLTLDLRPELPEVAAVIAGVAGVAGVAYRHRSGAVYPLVGDTTGAIEVAGRMMYLPAGSFFQTNVGMLPRVLERMHEEIAGRNIRTAADVYCGVGTFGLPLAASVDAMTLIELDPSAVAAACRTAAEWGLSNVTFVDQLAERALPSLPALDLIILDPPRSGLGPAVAGAVAANGAPLVLYLSCAPASLARDVAHLAAAGYRLRSLDVFDFYPQTYHVESLAVLTR
jgi:23S rRNA (uracil1939-C5)-methyltransferase